MMLPDWIVPWILAGAGMCLVGLASPLLVCVYTRTHRWGPWSQTDLRWEERWCRRCCKGEKRTSYWWSTITAPAEPDWDPYDDLDEPTIEARYLRTDTVEQRAVPLPPGGPGRRVVPGGVSRELH